MKPEERFEHYQALLHACDHIEDATRMRRLIQLALRMPDMSEAEQLKLLERAEAASSG